MSDRKLRLMGAGLCTLAVVLVVGNHLWLAVIALAAGWTAILTGAAP